MSRAWLASAPVTNWPARLALTLLLVLALAGVLVLMRRAWVARGGRQGDIPRLPVVPPLPTGATERGVEARYLGATRAGDWLDRVVVHGLGVPSAAHLWTSDAPDGGVWVMRTGAPDLFLARSEIIGVRHDRAIAGRVLEAGGVLVITWNHGPGALDLGLRVRSAEHAEGLRATIASIAGPSDHPQTRHPATTGDPA